MHCGNLQRPAKPMHNLSAVYFMLLNSILMNCVVGAAIGCPTGSQRTAHGRGMLAPTPQERFPYPKKQIGKSRYLERLSVRASTHRFQGGRALRLWRYLFLRPPVQSLHGHLPHGVCEKIPFIKIAIRKTDLCLDNYCQIDYGMCDFEPTPVDHEVRICCIPTRL